MFWRQLYLLLWKNFILRKRHWLRTVVEILWPLVLFLVLIAIRKTQSVDNITECHYPARAMPSAGVYPWMKSLLCDLQNPCFNTMVPSEVPGQVNAPSTSNDFSSFVGLVSLLNSNSSLGSNATSVGSNLQNVFNAASSNSGSFSEFLESPTAYGSFLVTNLSLSNSTVDALLSANVTSVQASALPTVFSQSLFVCNQALLAFSISIAAADRAPVSAELCSLTGTALSLLSSYTNESLRNTSEVVNATQLANALASTSLLATDLQALQAPLSSLLGLTTMQNTGGSSLLSLLSGDSSAASEAFRDFCGHPSVSNQGFVQLFQNLSTDSASGGSSFNINFSSANFCNELFATLENDNYKFFWDTIKPLLLGKIPYSPNTPLVQSIIAEANSTFESIAFIKTLGESWSAGLGPDLYRMLENGTNTNVIRGALADDVTLNFLAISLNVTVSSLEQLRAFLSNEDNPSVTTWKDLYRQIDAAVVLVTKLLGCMDLNKFEGFDEEYQLVDRSLDLINANNTLWGSIVFLTPSKLDTTLPNVVRYKIRQEVDSVTRTNGIQRFFWRPTAEEGVGIVKYYVGGFVHIQDMIEKAIVRVASESRSTSNQNSFGHYLQQMPYPCYTRDRFLEYLSGLFSLLMTLAWIYSVCIIIKDIVYEKEQRLKEVMKMMGLSNGVHWVAWFINSFVVMLVSILLLIIILKAGAVTPYSNAFIILLWLIFFAFATITQCFLITTFFTRANLAAACGGIIFFLLYIPYNMVYAYEDKMTIGTKLIACLLSTVAFGYGSFYVAQYEMSGEGIQFSNWSTSPDPSDDFSFLIATMMMLFDACLYMLLTWYIENVFPGTYGVPRPWYFFVTRSYWCGTTKRAKTNGKSVHYDQADPSLKLEVEPTHLPLGVSMSSLRKVYGNGKVAVDDLSLNFYEGQITSFLGHNGAGKTTTMSMLTGLFTPTAGSATIYGNDIQTEMDEIRHQLGFCPQHNVLFGSLTVFEHLQLYSGLKNAVAGKPEDENEIEQMLNDVGLPQKKNEITRHLSGGMKRKLSVAVAFVGGSKCVILDEPTAGVDPYARRGIWDLLLGYRASRTIILSTHHMDEADLLGDRIAIISHGRLKCCGSSLFLKSTFGVGYYLTVVKKQQEEKQQTIEEVPDQMQDPTLVAIDKDCDSSKGSDEGFVTTSDNSSSTPSLQPADDELYRREFPANDIAQTAHITNLVTKTIPKSRIHEESPREITFVLPYSSQATGKYSELFGKLDECNITYGLTDTSLEEIFLTVAEDSKDEAKEEKTKCCFCIPRKKKSVAQAPPSPDSPTRIGLYGRSSFRRSSSVRHRSPSFNTEDLAQGGILLDDGSEGKGSYRVSGSQLVWQQFKALLVKRFHHARRYKKGLIAQVLVPAIFIALALAFALAIPPRENMPLLELQPWMYGDTNTFYSDDLANSSLSRDVSNALLTSPTLGMRCVNNYQVTNYNDKPIACEKDNQNGLWANDDGIAGRSQELANNISLVCQCTDKDSRELLADCPDGAGGPATPRFQTETSDWMYNMTGRNLSDWLVKTVDRFIQNRYGGLSMGELYQGSISAQQFTTLLQLLQSNSNGTLNIPANNTDAILQGIVRTENAKVWFDNNGWHAMPTWMNILNNAALRSLVPPNEAADYGITAISHPLNYTKSTVDLAALSQSITDTLISISVIFALSFIPASFVLFLIEERITKSKHLQFVSGVNQTVYWISTFLWDMINYFVPMLIILLIFVCFQTKAYVSSDNFPCLFCLLLLYGFAVTPMMYPASFFFKVPSTAYVVLTCTNMFIGINASLATFILELLDDPSLNEANEILTKLFLIFPQYCLGRGLIDMALNQAYADAYASFGIDRFVNPFTFSLVGRNLMALALEGLFFYTLTILIQYRFFVKPKPVKGNWEKRHFNKADYDDDVAAEKERLLNGHSDDLLQIRNLTKVFKKRGTNKNLIAVDGLCLGVPEKECFGLLGVNGAGKTTTFKMLTGDTVPSAGDALICEQSILENIREVQQNTGYCPQFDALNSLLTGREHLIFYAKLRGVPPNETGRVAEWAINKFGLKIYADKPAGTYSGGNKRKLSAAIAFIGCPPIVFLDEPTAGMDPMSRRFLWSRISEAVRGGRCIVLTSHSMEECEALCTRLAIMVNGKLKCIGSPQHLKSRYGEGYTIMIKVAGLNPDFAAVQNFISQSFSNAILKESHCNMLMYQIPLEEVKLSHLFDIIESNKAELQIEDYSVSQTTLDEVFVSFAKNQTDGVEEDDSVEAALPDEQFVNQVYVTEPSGEVAGTDGIVMKNLPSNFYENTDESSSQNLVS